jgi:hypothetical protein
MRVRVAYEPRGGSRRSASGSLEEALKSDGVAARVLYENPLPFSPETAHTILVHLEPIVDGVVVAALGSIAKWAMSLRRARKKNPELQNFRVLVRTGSDKSHDIAVDLTQRGVTITGDLPEPVAKRKQSAPAKPVRTGAQSRRK